MEYVNEFPQIKCTKKKYSPIKSGQRSRKVKNMSKLFDLRGHKLAYVVKNH